jgi:HlyD family secretion protein
MEKSLALSESEGRKQIDTMQRVIDTLSTKLALARENLDTLQVRAPIRGQLTSFSVHVGQRVTPAQRIGQINQVDKTKIVASVDEFYLNRVSMNQPASLVVDGKTFHLKVTKIYPEVHDRVFNVDFAFAGDSVGNMRIGQSMELRLTMSTAHEVLIVANGPFYEFSDHGVFVVDDKDQIATRRNVAFGRRNAESIEILDGLTAGEQVITSSYQTFKGINQLRFR